MESNHTEEQKTQITRREALAKAGTYVAFTAAASMLILTPKKAAAQSLPSTGWTDPSYKGGGQSGNSSSSPFDRPTESSKSSHGLKDSPWK